MKDQDKTKKQLIDELGKWRQKSAELEVTKNETNNAEEKLRAYEERYRSIVEVASDGIATVNIKGEITSCNTSFLKMACYSKDEIVGKHFSKLPTLRSKDLPFYIKMFNSLLRGKLPKPFEFR